MIPIFNPLTGMFDWGGGNIGGLPVPQYGTSTTAPPAITDLVERSRAYNAPATLDLPPVRSPGFDPMQAEQEREAERMRAAQQMMDLANRMPPSRSSTYTAPVTAKGEKSALDALMSDYRAQADLVNREREDERRQRLETLQLEEREYATRQAQLAEEQRRQAAAEERLAAADAEFQKRRADYEKNGSVRDMYDGRPGAVVMAAISTALGTYASVRSGTPNYAAQVIKDQEDRWYQQEISRVAKSKELLSLSVDERDKAMNWVDAQIKNYQAARLSVVAQERAQLMAKHGYEDVDIERDALLQKINAERDQKMLDYQKSLRGAVSSTTSNAPANEMRQRAALLAAGKPEKKQIGQEAAAAVNRLDSAIESLGGTIRELEDPKNKKAVDAILASGRVWQYSNTKTPGLAQVADVGRAFGKIPHTQEEALAGGYFEGPFKRTPKVEGETLAKAREILRGMQELPVIYAKGLGGAVTEADTERAREVTASTYGSGKELVTAMKPFMDRFQKERDLYTREMGISPRSGAEIPKTSMAREQLRLEYSRAMDRLQRNPNDQEAMDTILKLNRLRGEMQY